MHDIDVRMALRNSLAIEHSENLADTKIVEEMGIYGEVRVDVAVLNGQMVGYELKSERDTLKRLPKQVEYYSKVMDRSYIVVAKSHLRETREIVPNWWGIIQAVSNKDGTVELTQKRKAKENRNPDPQVLALLLWKAEALNALEERGLDKGFRSKTRFEMTNRLASEVPVSELRDLVRETLKRRKGWLPAPQFS